MKENNICRPAIMIETGADEAFMVGTVEELRAFATTLLNLLDQDQSKCELLGVAVSQLSQTLTFPLGDVCISGVVIASSTEGRRMLIDNIRLNNGEPQIDPEAWEKESRRTTGDGS